MTDGILVKIVQSCVSVVIGASRGVGKGIAESVGKPGDTIICVGRSVDSGTTVNQFGFEINSSLIDTASNIEKQGISCAIVTAQTPLGERMNVLSDHEKGKIEAVVSVGVLLEGWDNPNCNIIVHLRPTLSKVLWGQSVGRGLRSAKDKSKCIVIDVSSNWSTFGPVEKLKWELWSHRRSYLRFKNRFNWLAEQLNGMDENQVYLLCQNQLPNKMRCSYIYKKNTLSDDACPMCGTFDAVDIQREQMLDSTQTEASRAETRLSRFGSVQVRTIVPHA